MASIHCSCTVTFVPGFHSVPLSHRKYDGVLLADVPRRPHIRLQQASVNKNRTSGTACRQNLFSPRPPWMVRQQLKEGGVHCQKAGLECLDCCRLSTVRTTLHFGSSRLDAGSAANNDATPQHILHAVRRYRYRRAIRYGCRRYLLLAAIRDACAYQSGGVIVGGAMSPLPEHRKRTPPRERARISTTPPSIIMQPQAWPKSPEDGLLLAAGGAQYLTPSEAGASANNSSAAEGIAREFHDALGRSPDMAVAVAAIKVSGQYLPPT